MEPTRPEESVSKLGPAIQIDEGRIQTHLDKVVRSTVEEALNALLEAKRIACVWGAAPRTQRQPPGHILRSP